MKHLESVLPKRAKGGSRIGWSSISQFRECELAWFMANVLPHPKGGHGVAGGEGRALWVGSRVHDALQGWFLSAPETGDYDADAGYAALEKGAAESGLPDREPDTAAQWTEEATQLFRRYTLECGPAGEDPDRDRFRVAIDGEGPIVERDFEVDLGYGGLYYTSRIDLVAYDIVTRGVLLIVEHKTCDVSRAGSALRGYALDPQLSGEALAVRAAWNSPVAPVINLLKKRAAVRSKFRAWEPMQRDERDLEKFRIDTIRTLKTMDERVDEYLQLVTQGVPHLEAGNLVFHGSPKGKVCADQGRECSFYSACYRRGSRESWLAATEPRFTVEDVAK